MLNLSNENYAFQTQTGTLIKLGYTHEELFNFLSTCPEHSSGWIQVDHGNRCVQNIHWRALHAGQPRFTDAVFTKSDRAMVIHHMGLDAADLLLANH